MKGKPGGRYFSRGHTWWIAYHDGHGKEIRESTSKTCGKKNNHEAKAQQLLGLRLKQVAKAELDNEPVVTPKIRRMLMSEALKLFQTESELNRTWNEKLASIWQIVHDRFADKRCESITKNVIQAYQLECRQQGLADSTIDHRTWLLLRAIRLAGLKPDKVKKLCRANSNARQGFFEDWEVRHLLVHLPADLADFALACFLTGWRRSEVTKLKWNEIVGDMIMLPGPRSKNKKPRKIPITGELKALLDRRHVLQVEGCPLVFHRDQGQPVQDFRRAWRTALKLASLPENRLIHDFRRSRARILIRAGVSEKIVMDLCGWSGRSMFDRYNISDERDLRLAQEKTERYAAQETERYLSEQVNKPVQISTAVQ